MESALVTVIINIADVLGNAVPLTSVRFTPLSAPFSDGDTLVVGATRCVETDANGQAQILIETGNYQVRVLLPGVTNSFEITVPDTGGPFQLVDLVTAGINPLYEIPLPSSYPPGNTVCTIGLAAGIAVALG